MTTKGLYRNARLINSGITLMITKKREVELNE